MILTGAQGFSDLKPLCFGKSWLVKKIRWSDLINFDDDLWQVIRTWKIGEKAGGFIICSSSLYRVPQDASGKWRLRLGSPTKNIIIPGGDWNPGLGDKPIYNVSHWENSKMFISSNDGIHHSSTVGKWMLKLWKFLLEEILHRFIENMFWIYLPPPSHVEKRRFRSGSVSPTKCNVVLVVTNASWGSGEPKI